MFFQSAGTAPESSTLRGTLYMLAAMVCFSAMHGAVRHLSGGIHPFEIAFFRNFFGLVVVIPWFLTRGWAPFETRHFGLHLTRALLNVVAMLMFFTALSLSPLVQVQALGFTAPLFTTALAAVMLGEPVRLRRWSAILLGFSGTLIIIRPGIQPVELGSMLTVISAAIWALCMIIIKRLSRTDSSVTITTYMVVLMSPLSLVAAAFVWVWPTPGQWGWLLLTGLLGTTAQLLMTEAFRVADATVVLPLDFTKIVWAALIGYVFFDELVDTWTWVGAVVIFSGATYVAVRERRLETQRIAARRGPKGDGE